MLEQDTTTGDPADAPAGTASDGARPPKPRRRGLDRATASVGVLVALAGAGLYYMHARTAPGVAAIGDAQANAAGVTSMLAGGQESVAALARSIRTTREVVDRIVGRGDATLAAAAKPATADPFVFATIEPTQVAARPQSTNVAAREQARTRALDAARRLQLQSIMYGSTRRSCLIDGRLYFEGQAVGEFTVARIATGSILVQSGEFKFELRLRK